jgi:DNA repair ATPase RecN
MKKWRWLWLLAPLVVGVILILTLVQPDKPAGTDVRDLVESNAINQLNEDWNTMEALNREALKEIDRINRLREFNKGAKDLEWWKRLNEQGDRIKEIAGDISTVRTALTVIRATLYYDANPPTLKELNETQSRLRGLEEMLKSIRKALDELKSA